MKNTLILLFFVFITTESFSQNSFGKYELTLNGNYKTQSDIESIENYQSNKKSNNSKISIGVNRSINQWLLLGFGMTYLNNNDEYDYAYYDSLNEFEVRNYPTIESIVWLPFVNMKFIKTIGNNVFFGLNLINAYGFMTQNKILTTELRVKYLTDGFYDPSDMITGGKSSKESERDDQYYNFSIEPEITYLFSKSFGIKLQGILYQFDSINNHQTFFSTKTNQITWTLGIEYRIN